MLSLPAAREYVQRGWAVIPVPLKSKRPILPQWQKLKLKPEELEEYFKVDCNIGVLLGEPSDGLIDIDLDCNEAIILAREILPPTSAVFGRKSTPRSHWLYYAEGQKNTNRFQDIDGQVLVEYRATGGQTVFPASIHESGEAIEWAEDGTPAMIAAGELYDRVKILAAAAIIRRHWPTKRRHDTCLALAGGMMRSGWMEADVLWFIEAATVTDGKTADKDRATAVRDTFKNFDRKEEKVWGWRKLADILGERVVRQVRDYLPVKELPKIEEPPPEIKPETNGHKPLPEFEPEKPFTDYGNAERLVAEHGQMIRYCKGWKEWFIWKGSHWMKDEDGEIVRRAKKTVRKMYSTATDIEDDGIRESLIKHARKSEAKGQILAMIGLAETEAEVVISMDKLDADSWLLACPNGTLNLKTGMLRGARQEDLMTRCTATNFNPTAPAPEWEKFLDRVFTGSAKLIEFVQMAFGYSLTGEISERLVFILYGTGRNGKSTFLEVLRRTLGKDYAATTSSEVLLANKHSNEDQLYLAELQGIRMAITSETAEGRALAEDGLKHFSGDEEISARRHYSAPFQYVPKFKMWMATNHRPEIRTGDQGLWDRLREVPFNVRIEDDEVDRDLKEKLLKEREGILAWGVRGCLMWQQRGLKSPEEVIRATASYRSDSDLFTQFLEERCLKGDAFSVRSGVIYKIFAAWCEEIGEKTKSRKWLGGKLKASGFNNGNRDADDRVVWSGLTIRHWPDDTGG